VWLTNCIVNCDILSSFVNTVTHRNPEGEFQTVVPKRRSTRAPFKVVMVGVLSPGIVGKVPRFRGWINTQKFDGGDCIKEVKTGYEIFSTTSQNCC
jgi:hypothetical protein